MKYTLEVIITVLEILKEKAEGVVQVAMAYEDLEKAITRLLQFIIMDRRKHLKLV